MVAALELMIDMNFADPDRRGCLAVNTAAELAGFDVEATAHVRTMFERTTEAFLAAIRLGQSSGEVRVDLDPNALATHLLTPLLGVQLLSKTACDPDRLKRSVEIAFPPSENPFVP